MVESGAATVLRKGNLLHTLYPAIIEEGMLTKIAAYLQKSIGTSESAIR